ncbi:MAG: hypothetical protein K6E99_05605, partial [Bacilli bacterium]|nr:hypothetical protein [Bacilli bacterium]
KIIDALTRKRNENQKHFYVGLSVSGALFLLGIIYIISPSIITTETYKVNNFVIIMLGVYALLNLVKFIVINYKTYEKVYLCLGSCAIAILNVILSAFIDATTVFTMCIMLFTLVVTGVKLFAVDYYYQRKDSYWYIITMLLIIFLCVGLVISTALLNHPDIQVVSLGFFIIIIAILDAVDTSIKCMLRAPRFVKNIKLK